MSKHLKFSIKAKQTLGRKTNKAKAKIVTEANENEDYDNEEDENELSDPGSLDVLPPEYMSLQPHEVETNVLHPDFKAMVEYL